MAPGNNRVSAISSDKFSSMPESTQTLQADLCYVKRCSCVVFFLKPQRKDLTNRHESLPPPPPPSPSVPPNNVKRILAVFLPCSTWYAYLVYPNSAFFQEGGAMGCVCVCVGGGGGWGDRTLGLFIKSFLPASRGKKGTSFHITQVSL